MERTICPTGPPVGPLSGRVRASADRWTSSNEQVDPSAIRSVRKPKRCDSVPHSSAAATTIRSYPAAAGTTASTGSSASMTRKWTGTGCVGSRKTRWTSTAAPRRPDGRRSLGVTWRTVTSAPLCRPSRGQGRGPAGRAAAEVGHEHAPGGRIAAVHEDADVGRDRVRAPGAPSRRGASCPAPPGATPSARGRRVLPGHRLDRLGHVAGGKRDRLDRDAGLPGFLEQRSASSGGRGSPACSCPGRPRSTETPRRRVRCRRRHPARAAG